MKVKEKKLMNGYINHSYKRWLETKSNRDRNVHDCFMLVAITVMGYDQDQVDQARFGKAGTLDSNQERLFNLLIGNK